MPDLKLYHASSVIPEWEGYKNVTCHWSVEYRRPPVAPDAPLVPDYAPLVEGYNELDARQRGWTIKYLESLFTEAELAQLREFLQTMEVGLDVEEVPLPLPRLGKNQVYISYADMDQDYFTYGLAAHVDLTTFYGYDLPFKVWGYINLQPHIVEERRTVAESIHVAIPILAQHKGTEGAIEVLRQHLEQQEQSRGYVEDLNPVAAAEEHREVWERRKMIRVVSTTEPTEEGEAFIPKPPWEVDAEEDGLPF